MTGSHPKNQQDTATAMVPDTLAASVVVLFGVAVMQRLVGFGRSVLFCRWLEPEELGKWDMAFAFLMLAAPVAVLSLPSAFGRYVEHYRQRGQLRSFLRRMVLAVAILSLIFGVVILLANTWFSKIIFGRTDETQLVMLLAGALLALIACNVVVELFTALRLQRVASGLFLFKVTCFAVIGAVLLFFRPEAASVILAFGSASALTVMASLFWLWRCWQTTPVIGPAPAHTSFWPKVLQFTGWLWLTNWLANLFTIADRYMIVHFSGLPTDDALAVVGQYHCARIVPLLLLGVAAMLASVITPHLSRDWEVGQRQTVCERLNLFWKTMGFALTAGGVLFLFCAPLLFDIAFAGKFAGGQAVLSWTLMTAIWAGLTLIVQIYLLCAEQPRISTLAFAIGLPLNVFLNFLLLPRWGLLGAVVSTSISHFVVLACVVGYVGWRGFRVDAGAVLATLLPVVLYLGPWVGLAALAGTALIAISTDLLITREEKRRLALLTTQFLEKLRIRGQQPAVAIPRQINYE